MAIDNKPIHQQAFINPTSINPIAHEPFLMLLKPITFTRYFYTPFLLWEPDVDSPTISLCPPA